MNEEIREILNCMNVVVFYDQGMKLDTEQCKILHDYIIDLEEKIDKVTESIKIMKEKNDMYGTKSLSIDINHLETLLNILQGDDK